MRLSFVLGLLTPLAYGASIFQHQQYLPQAISNFFDNGINTLTSFTRDHELIALHKSLVETNSVSGQEEEVGKFLEGYLKSKGFTVEVQQVTDKRANIFAYFGSKRSTKVLLTSHIDTVPPFFPYYIEDDKIYGRGSVDAKASVATQILASIELFQSHQIKDGDVSLLFVVGEEVDGIGMKYASDHLDADWEHAVYGEPTENKLGVGHKGMYHFDIDVEGKASHSGYPELGIDANKKLIDILYQIIHSEFPSDEDLGITTVNPGLIEAGVAGNVVSPKAKAKTLIRIANSAFKVKERIDSIIERENKEYHNVKLTDYQLFEPVYLNHTIPGFNTVILAYFTDIPNLERDFKSRYLYGPGTIHVAHSADEFIYFSELNEAVDGYKKIVKYLLEQ